MPQRITSVLMIVLGLAGVLALGVLILLRIDAHRAEVEAPARHGGAGPAGRRGR